MPYMTGDKKRINSILICLVALVVVTGLSVPFIKWAACNRLEDYLITLRYARNAASGMGIVFSEGQHYQGFTSPLQFCAGYLLCLMTTDVEIVPGIICLIGLLSVVLFGVNLAFWIAGRLCLSALVVAVCLVLSSVLFLEFVAFDSIWALGLASTGLSFAFIQRYRVAGLFLGLAILSRHDAVLPTLLLCIYLAFKGNRRGLVRVGSILLLVSLPWYVFATCYFGSPIPSSLHEKMQQGASGKPQYDHDMASAMEQPFRLFPLNSNQVLVGAGILALVAVALWLMNRRNKSKDLIKIPTQPFWLIIAWSVLHCLAYFLILKVPFQYPWYHVYSTAALLAVIAYAPIQFVVQGEERAAGWIREKGSAAFGMLLIVLGIGFSGYAYIDHLVSHVPRHNSGRYRYAGYRAAAEWINKDAEASDTVRISEIGVFGWYCPLYVEDAGGITMPKVPIMESDFRYLVRAANPGVPVLPYVFHVCDLVASFPNPGDFKILIYKRK